MAEPDAVTEVGRLPVVEEALRIVKRRRVTGRVRVAVGTTETPEAVATVRRSRLVEIERVRIDQEVDAPPPVRQEGDMVVVPVLEERLVLVRRLVVTEEVRFRLRMEEEPVTLSAAVRRQDVEVTRLPVDEDASPRASATDQTTNPGETYSMQRTLTAMFDSRGEAERAAEALRGLGIGASDVHIHPADQGSGATTGSASNLFVADEDRATYHEGLRRGHVLVSAKVEDRYLDHAMDAMEAAGAVDLDAREASWRQEGWTGHAGTGVENTNALAGAGGAALGTSSDGDRTAFAATRAEGSSSSNPPGTMASRAVDQVAGTNISGAHPEHERRETTATAGTTGTGVTGTTGTAAHGLTGREETIPIVEERLRIGKREAHAGRVRVRSYVVETPIEEQVHLREERVHVERHAVDRPLTGNEADVFRERVIEAEESTEEAVVAKEARVTGEVVVNKEVRERTETIRDSVRRTEVEVDEDNVANTNATRRDNKGVA
jgi:stress response protein YsnF